MGRMIAFEVTDEQAERMLHEAVYIDVYGVVRWQKDGSSLLVRDRAALVHVTAALGEAH